MKTMDMVDRALFQIFNWIDETLENMKEGVLPEQGMLKTMAELMETVAFAFQIRLNNPAWMQFYQNMSKGYIPVDFADRLLQWMREAEQLYDQNREEDGLCNICREKVQYQPASNFFRVQQRKHGFPYWNAVFESLSRKHRSCPICQSMDRERMISLFLDMLKPEGDGALKVLHIAPSRALNQYLKKRDDMDCETIDLYMKDVSIHADIQNLSMIEAETYDVIICSHILEHVENDRRAMLELRRVLKEDGVCIFLVPLVIGLDKTDEAFGLSAEENWKRFGQEDHARLYGREDFLTRLIQAGYLVHVLRADYFGEEIWKRNGLSDTHCLYVASKKNIGIGVEPYRMSEDMEKELVSVVIPTRNRAGLITRSVKSVLTQTWQNLEVIVVDDASTDNTEDVIRGIEDTRVRYIRLKTNGGANHARNVGVEAARGRYVAFNDSDDEWLPKKLEKQMKLMHQSDLKEVGCVYCVMTRRYDEVSPSRIPETVPDLEAVGESAVGDIYYYMQGHMFISTQMLLLKKEAIEAVGGFNENLKRLQDWEFLLRIAKKYKFTLVQESLVNVYMQKDCVSTDEEGFIDTVRHVIQSCHMKELNVKAYEFLTNTVIRLMKAADLPKAYKENVLFEIEQDGMFSQEKILNIQETLGLKNLSGAEVKTVGFDTELMMQMRYVQREVEQNNRMLHEILWAQVFQSSRPEYAWLYDDVALWPGRWGVGYQYMYVVSRLLNAVQPKNILETGLGQSTRLIGSYVRYISEKCECRHTVIEHDQNWIETFRQDYILSSCTRIIQRNLATVKVKQGEAVSMTYIYQNMDEIMKGQKFDFISLDGPYGTDELKGYSRIDILNYIPDCLEKDFCIVLDDYNRNGEKNTVECMKNILSSNHIDYAEAVYRGTEDLYLITSVSWNFLCTL